MNYQILFFLLLAFALVLFSSFFAFYGYTEYLKVSRINPHEIIIKFIKDYDLCVNKMNYHANNITCMTRKGLLKLTCDKYICEYKILGK